MLVKDLIEVLASIKKTDTETGHFSARLSSSRNNISTDQEEKERKENKVALIKDLASVVRHLATDIQFIEVTDTIFVSNNRADYALTFKPASILRVVDEFNNQYDTELNYKTRPNSIHKTENGIYFNNGLAVSPIYDVYPQSLFVTCFVTYRGVLPVSFFSVTKDYTNLDLVLNKDIPMTEDALPVIEAYYRWQNQTKYKVANNANNADTAGSSIVKAAYQEARRIYMSNRKNYVAAASPTYRAKRSGLP